MKKLFISLIMVIGAWQIAANEVYFVPGWYSEWKSYTAVSSILQEIFPGDTIHIRKWESNKLWDNAKAEAEKYAETLTAEIIQRPAPEVILIGHSLGGRIILDCAAGLAQQKKQVRQIILLGTADGITAEDIKNCQMVSLLPVINIFCVDDNMLKLFMAKEKFHPLGLSGLPEKVEHFQQYRLHVADHHITFSGVKIIDKKIAEPFRETVAHLTPFYLERLKQIVNGEAKECYYNLEALENIALEHAVESDSLPGFSGVEEFNGWLLEHRSYHRRYRITSPSGKKFHFDNKKDAIETFSRLKTALKEMENCFSKTL